MELLKYFEVVFGSFELVMSEYLMGFKKGYIFMKYFFSSEDSLQLLLLGVYLCFGN